MLIRSKKVIANFAKMHEAIKANDGKLVKALLETGFDPNSFEDNDKITPLHKAALRGATNVIPHLIKAGAKLTNKTAEGFTPLELARDPETLALLRKYSCYEIDVIH